MANLLPESHDFFFLAPYKEKLLLFSKPLFIFEYYQNQRKDLITQEISSLGIAHLWDELEKIKVEQYFQRPKILKLNFELNDSTCEDEPLAIIAEFESCQLLDFPCFERAGDLEYRITEHPLERYQEQFNLVQKRLKRGDSYQVNLTHVFQGKFLQKATGLQLALRAWSNPETRGAFGHLLNLKDKSFFSNSPECLFQTDQKRAVVQSLPIKGTAKDRKELLTQKNVNELNMITDLIRNDLTRLELEPCRTLNSRSFLEVPGLIHTYSINEVGLSINLSLSRLIKCLFPGGSITGAPKDSTTRIIREIEDQPRGSYCGSTIIAYKKLLAGSVNIRSMDLDHGSGRFSVGAGGGVTVKSTMEGEYQELLSKRKSLFQSFGANQILTNCSESSSRKEYFKQKLI